VPADKEIPTRIKEDRTAVTETIQVLIGRGAITPAEKDINSDIKYSGLNLSKAFFLYTKPEQSEYVK
jgi:hypothetical protein